MNKAPKASHEVYEPQKVEAIFRSFEDGQKNGRYTDYQILIDDFPVIGRTADADRFMDYDDFISPNSGILSVLLFKNKGSDKFYFHFRPDTIPSDLKGLSGSQDSNADLVMRGRLEAENENLKAENKKLKEENEQYLDEMEEIFQALDREKAKNSAGFLGMVPGIIEGVRGFMNPQASGNLSGTPNENKKSEGSFKRKREAEDVEAEPIILSERDKGHLKFIESIRQRIGDLQMVNVMHLLDLCASYPDAVPYAIRMLTRYLNDRETKTDDTNGKEKI